MKRYDPTEAVPMAFHKFNHWVRIPLLMVASIFRLFELYQRRETISGADVAYFALDLVYAIVILMLLYVAFVGFFQRKSDAFKANIAILILGPINIFVQFIHHGMRAEDIFLLYLGTFLLSVIMGALIAAYYLKRRLLFSANNKNASAPDEQTAEESGTE